MIHAGYMLKTVIKASNCDWISSKEGIDDIYSVTDHGSTNFTQYINYWKHNGFWLFDSQHLIAEIAALEGIDTGSMTLFYYEFFEQEYNEFSRDWSDFEPDSYFPLQVKKPTFSTLEGFDVVTFFAETLLNAHHCFVTHSLTVSLLTAIVFSEHLMKHGMLLRLENLIIRRRVPFVLWLSTQCHGGNRAKIHSDWQIEMEPRKSEHQSSRTRINRPSAKGAATLSSGKQANPKLRSHPSILSHKSCFLTNHAFSQIMPPKIKNASGVLMWRAILLISNHKSFEFEHFALKRVSIQRNRML